MKLLTVQITIKDVNRYASDTNIGIENIDNIFVLENYESKVPKATTIKNDGTMECSKEHNISKQQLLDQIIQNIRYLQANPDMK